MVRGPSSSAHSSLAAPIIFITNNSSRFSLVKRDHQLHFSSTSSPSHFFSSVKITTICVSFFPRRDAINTISLVLLGSWFLLLLHPSSSLRVLPFLLLPFLLISSLPRDTTTSPPTPSSHEQLTFISFVRTSSCQSSPVLVYLAAAVCHPRWGTRTNYYSCCGPYHCCVVAILACVAAAALENDGAQLFLTQLPLLQLTWATVSGIGYVFYWSCVELEGWVLFVVLV